MTQFLFVRHGTHDLVSHGVICGRQPGVHLNSLGQQQAADLARNLSALPIDAIYSSPLERARETAEPLVRHLNRELHIAEEFNELDMGDWTGRTLAELDRIAGWKRWNSFRSGTSAPNGEWMLDVQRRVLTKVDQLRNRHRMVAIFTHGDVIRAALVYFLGLPIDLLLRIEIDLASVSSVSLSEDFIRVDWVNFTNRLVSTLDRSSTTAC